jgi:hypothetical protein
MNEGFASSKRERIKLGILQKWHFKGSKVCLALPCGKYLEGFQRLIHRGNVPGTFNNEKWTHREKEIKTFSFESAEVGYYLASGLDSK